MPGSPSSLEDWEVSLVRAMFLTGIYRRQDIHTYFSRPRRSINQARISQIVSGDYRPDVQPASQVQLQSFLATWSDNNDAKRAFAESDPLHPVVAVQTFRLRAGMPLAIDFDEGDWVEFKLSFNWASRALYAKTMAGLANNRGGYLVFGVHNETREVVGLRSTNFADLDPARISQFLNQHLSPAVRWAKAVVSIGGIEIGLIYVWQSETKPVVCAQTNGNDLRESEIYYRYVGLTRRIEYPELQQLLVQRDTALEARWQRTLAHIGRIGIDRAAIMDTDSGVVSGPSGSFVIDEELLPRLNFIRDGEFVERDGAPTLRLIGHVRPVSGGELVAQSRIEHRAVTDREIVGAFIEQLSVSEPIAHIRQLCHIQPKWIPVYFFVHQTGSSLDEIITILQEERTSHASYKAQQIKRLTEMRPPPAVSTTAYNDVRAELLAGTAVDVVDPSNAVNILRAIRTLRGGDATNAHVLPVLKDCFDRHYGSTERKMTDEIRYAATHLDYELYGRPPASGGGHRVMSSIPRRPTPA